MSHSITVRRSAEKELKRVPAPDRRRIVEAIDGLKEYPHAGRALKRGLQGLRRIRVGDWRVLYAVDDETSVVSVVRVAHRRDAYRRKVR